MMAIVCIPPRCSFCRFEFCIGTTIVTIHKNDTLSRQFPYGTDSTHLSITYTQCHRACRHHGENGGLAVACHSECIKFLPHQSWKFSQALLYSFEPPFSQEKRRVAWLRSSLISNLKMPCDLPYEIKSNIAQNLLREYAVVKARSCWVDAREFQKSTDLCINPSKTVWARYIEFEGVKYIASITNEPSDGHETLFKPSSSSRVDYVYISEDHLGIRQMVFSPSQAPTVPPLPGIWWRILPIPPSGCQLCGKTDGIKLRSLASTGTDDLASTCNIAWDIPPTTLEVMAYERTRWLATLPYRMVGFCEALGRIDGINSAMRMRMASFQCNSPTTTGYSFCWNVSLRFVHAHTAGEDLSFYGSIDRPFEEKNIWFYVPMHPSEYITHVWKRHRQNERELALIIETNAGRKVVVGPHLRPNWPSCRWTLLSTFQPNPSRIFFEDSPHGIRCLAFETPSPNQYNRPLILPFPISPFPKSTSIEDYFYTSAVLDNVVEVTPCRTVQSGVWAITGILLSYANGYQIAVGQVRLDHLSPTMRVLPSQKMTFTFSAVNGYPYLASIHSAPPMCSETDMEICWHGSLEWWFSRRQCKIYHNGQASPVTKF
ncbi:uncharacterized protein F4807DRAFT_434089 [Annulohypoxylon truncatum]|uniref:uncharacterized protein n=1 Tax=Annulohypoxylon truncatum TaxID=327061 RepID=UPI002007A7BF|nr:uncharacterized protein F4807DRAFT_434089 [Annulohypoxylon truncatum]KAI1207663.1 hypothetical protein F4807DRAFT_434089 [Annulohypoxylon truncatum]